MIHFIFRFYSVFKPIKTYPCIEFYETIHRNIKKQIKDRLKKLNCKELDAVIKCFNDIIHQKKLSFSLTNLMASPFPNWKIFRPVPSE